MTTNDQKITLILNKIEEKKLELEKLKTVFQTEWKTNKHYSYFSDSGGTINLSSIFESNLINVMADLLFRSEYIEKANIALGIQNNETKILGFTLDEWKHDIQKRLAYVTYQSEYKKLDVMKAEVEKLDSEENKTKRKLAEIENSL